jgi:glycosyltransferase involved in cell wall biosynthesis
VEEPPVPVTVVLAARMLWDKGVGEFVEAAKRLHDEGVSARFVLVGEPDPANPASVPEASLRAWHGRDGIEWWGRREDIPAILNQAHIACLPSYREGLPKSLLEAAACGLPIVTTDTPGCREVVTDGVNGFLVPVNEVDALAVALKKLIIDSRLRRLMGEKSRACVLADFSQARVIEETLVVYRELME